MLHYGYKLIYCAGVSMKTTLFNHVLLTLSAGLAAHECPEWIEYEAPHVPETADQKKLYAEALRRDFFDEKSRDFYLSPNTILMFPTKDIYALRKEPNGKVVMVSCSDRISVDVSCVHYDVIPEYYDVIKSALLCENTR